MATHLVSGQKHHVQKLAANAPPLEIRSRALTPFRALTCKATLLLLAASLGKVAYSDLYCGNHIYLSNPSSTCLTDLTSPGAAGSTETIVQAYDACGGRDFLSDRAAL